MTIGQNAGTLSSERFVELSWDLFDIADPVVFVMRAS
jgi:hypothetical protein